MNRHERCSFFREKPEVREMSPYISGFLFKIMRQVKIIFRGLAVFVLSQFSKYEMLVKLKHIAC